LVPLVAGAGDVDLVLVFFIAVMMCELESG
jgi:hypothetical protein